MKKWMRKLIVFMVAIIIVIGVDSCRDKKKGISDDEIFVAKDYATSVFEDTMPDDCTLVSAKGSTGEDRKDNIYEITLTYTMGDEGEKKSHWYKISVEVDSCTVLEDAPVDK